MKNNKYLFIDGSVNPQLKIGFGAYLLLDDLNSDILKLNAGYLANNKASANVLRSNGFELEGVRLSNAVFENRRVDVILVGRVLEV